MITALLLLTTDDFNFANFLKVPSSVVHMLSSEVWGEKGEFSCLLGTMRSCGVNPSPPEAVEDGPIRMEADHAVLHSHSVNKRLLVVEEVSVRDPQLVGNPVIQGQVERDPQVGQPLVPPVLLEVHGQRVVLRDTRERHRSDPQPLTLLKELASK